MALTRFRRILPYARSCVRELTQTLCFPPAHAEIYAGPHAEWLRDCLEYLPHLQNLIVNGLPFFDHASLLCLRYPSRGMRSAFPIFSLRLLEASGCTNATSTGLAEALSHFPDLVSLDLSKTAAARGKAVLSALKRLSSLRVLNLRSIGLRDDDFSIVAHSIRSRVRSLDISDNYLTDHSTRYLLELCLKETASAQQEQADDEPEEYREVGVTHLYVSKNEITVEGICGLLRSGRLQVLDAGILCATIKLPCPGDPGAEENQMELPSVSKLIPVLSGPTSLQLQYIRINYQIVTEDAPVEVAPSLRVELCGDLAPHQPLDAHELAADPSRHELDTESPAIYEMPGDLSFPVELPCPIPSAGFSDHASSSTCPVDHVSTSSRMLASNDDLQPLPITQDQTNELSPGWVDSPLSPLAADVTMRSQEHHPYHLKGLKARLEHRQSFEQCLHPGMLPKLQTLVLTEVPVTAEKYVVDRIIRFIKDAADETLISRQRARLTYALPPGRRRVLAEEEYARSLFSLQRIVLEMAPPQPTPKKIPASWRQYPSKSSTEDADSEAFWEAASLDFSFFDIEECGQPNSELVHTRPLAAVSGLELATNQTHPLPEPGNSDHGLFDVLEEIKRFRRERKAAYDNLVASGQTNPELEGYWPGIITVVKKPLDSEAGELDYYGNRYQAGWYYR